MQFESLRCWDSDCCRVASYSNGNGNTTHQKSCHKLICLKDDVGTSSPRHQELCGYERKLLSRKFAEGCGRLIFGVDR